MERGREREKTITKKEVKYYLISWKFGPLECDYHQ